MGYFTQEINRLPKQRVNCVYLDMDGVIADFSKKALSLWGIESSATEDIKGWDQIHTVVSKHVGFEVTEEKLWLTIESHGSEFFRDIPPYSWGNDLYNALSKRVPVVLMTTAISPAAAMGKMQWMHRWFPDARRHAITPCKHHFARPTALLIDDAEHNVREFSRHGGQSFLWPMPWNQEGAGAYRGDVLTKAFGELEAILNERA